MGILNRFAAPDVEEEKARMKALVETFKDNEDDDENKEDEEEN